MAKKASKNILRKQVHPAVSTAAIAGVVAVFIIIMVMRILWIHPMPYQNQMNIPVLSPNPTNAIQSFNDLNSVIPITPTILPSSSQGRLLFVYPDPNIKYSFEYPSTWEIFMGKRYPNWIRLNVYDRNKDSTCSISFSREVNDAHIPGTYLVKESAYGGKKVTVTTYYLNEIPTQEIIVFEDADPTKDSFTFIRIFFSPKNMQECQQEVDQILASLKFYY